MNAIKPVTSLTTAQIGKCGEFLVQYRLLKHAIESSPMATDNGIDLVPYTPSSRSAVTIQVKTNLRAKPSGGKGPLALDWWVPRPSLADLFALVALDTDQVWLFTQAELERFAQQKPEGRSHFYFYTDTAAQPRGTGKRIEEFDTYKIENRIAEIFAAEATWRSEAALHPQMVS